MTAHNALRARYLAETVATATPAQLVVMLYDRMVLDLARAQEALERSDRSTASPHLVRAQEIVMELRSTLDTASWPGAENLAALYHYVHRRLVAANVGADPHAVAECLALVEPLRDAWREAALVGEAA